jgi:hypothetical protein
VSTFKYTITKFDASLNLIVVVFDDGSWTEIRLANPLPKNIGALESLIKQYTPTKETMDALQAPDADLSYIAPLVGVEKECERLSLASPKPEQKELDPELEANLAMWEELEFQKRVGEALVALGVAKKNPATIPVAT